MITAIWTNTADGTETGRETVNPDRYHDMIGFHCHNGMQLTVPGAGEICRLTGNAGVRLTFVLSEEGRK